MRRLSASLHRAAARLDPDIHDYSTGALARLPSLLFLLEVAAAT